LGKCGDLISAIAQDQPDKHGDFWDQRQRISTSDNDFFHVDYKYHSDEEEPSSKGLVIICHGLQSNSNSSLSVDLAKAYAGKGLDVACINFRGCSGVPNDGLKAYHMGFSEDLKHYLSIVTQNRQKQPLPIFLSGFSLGANVVLKALGELGDSAIETYNIYGAAVCGAPFNNEQNVNFLQAPGFNKIVYNGPLLKSLKNFAISQFERFPDSEDVNKVDWARVATCDEISEFDDAFIAPLFGFESNTDYYRKTSCSNYLDDIRVPTLCLNSADDPFFDPAVFPWDHSCDTIVGRARQSPIKLVRTEHGGHLGYLFHVKKDDGRDPEEVSFMPSELARFVQHVFECRSKLGA
jgi:predicted alpha/beta-fold hydrolase